MTVTIRNHSANVWLFSLLKTIKFVKFLFSGKIHSQFLISTVAVFWRFFEFVRTNLYSTCFSRFVSFLHQILRWYQSRIGLRKGLFGKHEWIKKSENYSRQHWSWNRGNFFEKEKPRILKIKNSIETWFVKDIPALKYYVSNYFL